MNADEKRLGELGYTVQRFVDGERECLRLAKDGNPVFEARLWRLTEVEVLREWREIADRCELRTGVDFVGKPFGCPKCGSPKLVLAAATVGDDGNTRAIVVCERCGKVHRGVSTETPEQVRAWWPISAEQASAIEADLERDCRALGGAS